MPDHGSEPSGAAGRKHGPRCRHFSLADALVLIAALGLALDYLRMVAPAMVVSYSHLGSSSAFLRIYILWLWTWPVFLSAGSLALLVIRLLPPRPGLRRVARQPGLIASASASGAVAILSAFEVTRLANHGTLSRIHSELTSSWADSCGLVVFGAWLPLILGASWRREPGWIDLWGTIIGFAWLLTLAVSRLWRAFAI
jgi:hypothetical protein